MNFPPGYRDLPSFRTFARISKLEHPIENIFTFHSSMQISKKRTFIAIDDDAFLDLLDVREDSITGGQIRLALLKSQMVEETETPNEYEAVEFCEFNKGLFSARENGGKGGRKKPTNSTNRETEQKNQPIKESKEPTKEGTNEGMNGTVPHRSPNGNPPGTYGLNSNDTSAEYESTRKETSPANHSRFEDDDVPFG